MLVQTLGQLAHLIAGIAGIAFFIASIHSPSMLNSSAKIRLVQGLCFGFIFSGQVLSGFENLTNASSAAIFDAIGSALGIFGCIRLLVSLENSGKAAANVHS